MISLPVFLAFTLLWENHFIITHSKIKRFISNRDQVPC